MVSGGGRHDCYLVDIDRRSLGTVLYDIESGECDEKGLNWASCGQPVHH